MNKQDLYTQIYDLKNLILAYKKARKGKTKKFYIQKFEENLAYNLKLLHDELKNQTYYPRQLKTFILKDPKTRKISKSAFRDRVVHHGLYNLLEPIFEPIFIYDSCANRKNKGTLFAIKRFEKFIRKVSKNNTHPCFVLKADIKHYFQEVDHEILLNTIKRKIKNKQVINLITKIIKNYSNKEKGMPLGNLTSQFFANIYLNELDFFIKHKLKAKYYIRYVDDFVILHSSESQLKIWKQEVDRFLKEELKLELHKDKSKIIPLSKGIDFVGFRNYYHFRLLRKRNIKNMYFIIKEHKKGIILKEKLINSFQGWQAYAKWADSYNLINKVLRII
ncbi:MAG: reverse transcriptase domain-containing protein [archaeon]